MLERTMRRVALGVRPQRRATVMVRGRRQFYGQLGAGGRTGELIAQPEYRGAMRKFSMAGSMLAQRT